MVPCLPFCGILLIGCAGKPIETVRYIKQDIPDYLLFCQSSPDVPGDNATQRDVARYIVNLSDTAGDCRGKLKAVSALVKGNHPEFPDS